MENIVSIRVLSCGQSKPTLLVWAKQLKKFNGGLLEGSESAGTWENQTDQRVNKAITSIAQVRDLLVRTLLRVLRNAAPEAATADPAHVIGQVEARH